MAAEDVPPTNPEVAAVNSSVSESYSFPIVGIGASAGGLAAFEEFFSGMPADSDPDMAFVLVQHLAPDHKSILSDLIRRYTRMQVFEVKDGMQVEPNCAYIIPPNHDMAYSHGSLQLFEPSAQRGLRLPIDFFFCSLAQDQRERAICIVLSGTGSDGTQGLRAIKGEGGMAMAQSPETTGYDGMPRSAIATGLVDYVLPPAEMAAKLIAFSHSVFGKVRHPEVLAASPEVTLKKVFSLLRSHTGHDFSLYKSNTINRRIERRMVVQQVERLEDYVRFMQQSSAEVEALFRDLLIGVTAFFRDPEAMSELETKVIPRLFNDSPADSTIRVWVPGCSTGEEAYSIAMMLRERMDEIKKNIKIQVFATDIDRQAVDIARAGIYSVGIVNDVTPERLSRFFSIEPGNGYRIQKSIRDLLVFSEQDLIKDPPFSRLDLISCRNLLIYMGAELQNRLIPLFHYALKPDKFLFLGTSETIGDHVELFDTVDRKAKIFRRKSHDATAYYSMARYLPILSREKTPPRPTARVMGDSKTPPRQLTEDILLSQFAPTGVLVDEQGEILYLSGRSGLYLEPAPGDARMNIVRMAREGLAQELTIALRMAAARKEPTHRKGLKVRTNGDFSPVNLTVVPVTDPNQGLVPLFLVVIEEAPAAMAPSSPTEVAPGEIDTRIDVLEQELRAKEEYLQAATEELETSNEELKSSNEEMQSINEELQSANEELETSKEELQSVNEELATVNTELQNKVADLSRTNNDMNNLLAGNDIGTVFVDFQMRIIRFTPVITQVINLIPSDVGRPVGDIVSSLAGYDHLLTDIQAVLDTLAPREVEVRTKDEKWYLLRIRPYRTMENVIEGAVITFTDITELNKAREALRASESLRRLAVVVSDSLDAILVRDLTGRILAWNPAAERMYGYSESEALAMNIIDLIPNDLRAQELEVVRQLSVSEVVEPHRSRRRTRDGRELEVWLIATALVGKTGETYAIATTERMFNDKI